MSKEGKILSMAKQEGLNIKKLVIHNNLDSLATIDSRKNLRLQEIFLKADDEVLRALFRTFTHHSKKGDAEKVNTFIVRNRVGRNIKGIPKTLLRDCYGPEGKHYNLKTILNKIMRKYTGQIPDIHITWRKASSGKKYITWGTYREIGKGGIIKINKILDRSSVPRYVVESVVYHELLHFIVPTETRGDEYNVHTRKFKNLLAKFPHMEKADIWKKNYFFHHS